MGPLPLLKIFGSFGGFSVNSLHKMTEHVGTKIRGIVISFAYSKRVHSRIDVQN
jgi:hypothetical protein